MTPFPCECHASMFANKGNDAIVANEWPQHDAEVNVGHNMLMDAQTISHVAYYLLATQSHGDLRCTWHRRNLSCKYLFCFVGVDVLCTHVLHVNI